MVRVPGIGHREADVPRVSAIRSVRGELTEFEVCVEVDD